MWPALCSTKLLSKHVDYCSACVNLCSACIQNNGLIAASSLKISIKIVQKVYQ